MASLRKEFNTAIDSLLNEGSEQSYQDILNELKSGKTDEEFFDVFANQLSIVMNKFDEI